MTYENVVKKLDIKSVKVGIILTLLSTN